jgi:hypothetical protein
MKIFASMLKDSGGELIGKYLSAGGSANEILEAMAESKQKDFGSALAAIKILRFLFLKYLTYIFNLFVVQLTKFSTKSTVF